VVSTHASARGLRSRLATRSQPSANLNAPSHLTTNLTNFDQIWPIFFHLPPFEFVSDFGFWISRSRRFVVGNARLTFNIQAVELNYG
jgi:hypothetical protein